jgi:hypothetical protein
MGTDRAAPRNRREGESTKEGDLSHAVGAGVNLTRSAFSVRAFEVVVGFGMLEGDGRMGDVSTVGARSLR